MSRPTQLTNASIQELSLVLRHDENGVEFAPRNTEARMLAVKGAEKGLASKALDVLKSYFIGEADNAPTPVEYPVTEADDKIDGDSDGPSDYNAIVRAVCCLYNDIGAAVALTDDAARSAAIVACIDSFLDGLDDLRGADADGEKAGQRHSAGDLEHLAGIAAGIKGMGEHIAALQGHVESLGITGAETPETEGKPEDEGPESSRANDSNKADEVAAEPVIEEPAADPVAEAQEPEADKAGEIEMTAQNIAALVAAEVAKATAANGAEVEAAKAKAKAEADEAIAKAKADADAANERARLADETLRAAAGLAQQTTAVSGSAPAKKGMSTLEAACRAQMTLNPVSHTFGHD